MRCGFTRFTQRNEDDAMPAASTKPPLKLRKAAIPKRLIVRPALCFRVLEIGRRICTRSVTRRHFKFADKSITLRKNAIMRAIIFVRYFSNAFRRGAEKARGRASGVGVAAGAIVFVLPGQTATWRAGSHRLSGRPLAATDVLTLHATRPCEGFGAALRR